MPGVAAIVDRAIAEAYAKRAIEAVALLKRWQKQCDRSANSRLIWRDSTGMGLHSHPLADETREFLRSLERKTCPTCKGTGSKYPDAWRAELYRFAYPCPDCGGKGTQ